MNVYGDSSSEDNLRDVLQYNVSSRKVPSGSGMGIEHYSGQGSATSSYGLLALFMCQSHNPKRFI